MMILCLRLSEVLVFEGETEVVPPPGSLVEFRMMQTVGDISQDVLVSAEISKDHPARYDFDTLAPKLVVELEIHNPEACLE